MYVTCVPVRNHWSFAFVEVVDSPNRLGMFLNVELKDELKALDDLLKEAVAASC